MVTTNPPAGANLPPRPPNPPPTNAPSGRNRANPPQQPAQPQAKKSTPVYTSKLRSSNPLQDDPDSARIRARVADGGTPSQVAEEGYRVWRLNASLRRDIDDARKELHSPLSGDNDSARIKNRLEGGATAQEIAEEAYRVCRINAYLKRDANEAHGELRLKKKSYAVKDDALHEMQTELPEMRKALKRTHGLLESMKITIPKDLKEAYDALMTQDHHDRQPRKGMKNDVRLTKKEIEEAKKKRREELQRNKSGKGKGKAKEPANETVLVLLHAQNGNTYDMGKPMEEQGSDEEDAPSEAGDNGEARPMDTTAPEAGLAPDNVVAGSKRKNNASPEPSSKKAKPSEDSPAPSRALTTLSFTAAIAPVPKNPFASLKRKVPVEDEMGGLTKMTKLNIDGPFVVRSRLLEVPHQPQCDGVRRGGCEAESTSVPVRTGLG
jgi:hypothetical protein